MNAASLHSDNVLQQHRQREERETERLLRQAEGERGAQSLSSGRLVAAGPYGASQPAPGGSQYHDRPRGTMNSRVKGEWTADNSFDEGISDGLQIALLPSGYNDGSGGPLPHSSALVVSPSLAEYNNSRGNGRGNGNASLALAQSARPLAFPSSSVGVPGNDGARQIALLQGKLAQRLGPEYISVKPGPAGAGKIPYLEAYKSIDLANEVFGFNGWSCNIIRLDIDFLDELEGRRFNVGVSAIVRVLLRDGTYHEDCGYGNVENMKNKAQALEKAKKEAVTDARKRALRTFGRLLGNCLYDKKFTETAMKVKMDPPKYDVTSLKRGPEAPMVPTAGPSPADVTRNNSSMEEACSVRQPQVSSVAMPDASKQEQETGPARARRAEHSSRAHGQQIASSPSATRAAESGTIADESVAREQRRAQAAQRQAELRSKKMQQDARQAVESDRPPQNQRGSRSPLHGTYPQQQKVSSSPQTRKTSQNGRAKATAPQETKISPRQAHKPVFETDLFLDDINFSQSSDVGLGLGDDTSATLVDSADALVRKGARQGRFLPSPSSSFKRMSDALNKDSDQGQALSPYHKLHQGAVQESGAQSLAATQRAGAHATNKREHAVPVSRALDKRPRYAPARR